MASSLRTFLNSLSNNSLEPRVKRHLRNIYACLTMSILSATTGASLHLYTNLMQNAPFCALAGLISILLLLLVLATAENWVKTSFAFLLVSMTLLGASMGPMLKFAIDINPKNVVTALVGTGVIFTSSSICSILAKRWKWLYLAGPLVVSLMTLLIFALTSIYLRSIIMLQILLCMGLYFSCGCILYSTQFFIEGRRLGNDDFVLNSLLSFIFFTKTFWEILLILLYKEGVRQKIV